MKNRYRRTVQILLFAFTFQSLGGAQLYADHIFGRMGRMIKELHYHGTPPLTHQDGCVEQLAENIDWLEHHLDRYGSIVAKQPDIWGEARLTKHRDEYERIMYKELGKFEFRLNATISQSDASFLNQAIALSAAVDGAKLPEIKATTSATTATVGNTEANLKGAGGTLPGFAKYKSFVDGSENTSTPILGIEPVIGLDQQSRYLHHLHELRRINEGDDTSDSPGYSMNLVRIPVSMLPGKLTRTGFGAEITITATPVLSDDLLPTTFRNLVVNDVVDQLRLPVVRVTEGLSSGALDSVIAAWELQALFTDLFEAVQLHQDSPEAARMIVPAINKMLKIPLAVEIFASALNAELAGEMSVTTQRIHEVSPLGAPVPPTLGPAELVATPQSENILASPSFENLETAFMKTGTRKGPEITTAIADTRYTISQVQSAINSVYKNTINPAVVKKFSKQEQSNTESSVGASASATPAGQPQIINEEVIFRGLQNSLENKQTQNIAVQLAQLTTIDSERFERVYQVASQTLDQLSDAAGGDALCIAPTGRARVATNPLSPSSLTNVMGLKNFITISNFFQPAYTGRYIRWNGASKVITSQQQASGCNTYGENRVNLLDAQRFLKAEIDTAYELLSESHHLLLFSNLADTSSGLSDAVRSHHLHGSRPGYPSVEQYRHYFFNQLHQHRANENPSAFGYIVQEGTVRTVYEHQQSPIKIDQEARNVVEALAWAVVVESALLNERLNRDVRKLANAQGVHDLKTARDYKFFLPDSVFTPNRGLEDLQSELQEAAQIFKRYVEVRWPIHVFAIDPREQDQNIADVSARKRELQFALALGFMSGKVGASSLTQFSRKMETQVETIALNRTVVGFGHGNDTFGWRFYPRVQALDVPGTLGVLKQTLTGVSRDDDLKHRKLEPGMRECVAVVLMPSFVPYADFDIRTNWFKLTNPKNAVFTMKDTLRFSRDIASMRNSQAQCSQCAHLYRAGEVERMMKRVDQLDRELPLQTMRAQVPYENTLGGFEMFNTGVTDLSPELIGWHGAPGIVTKNVDGNVYTCGCDTGCPVAGDANPQALLSTCQEAGTTLFLVGDNFSVHDTRVIAGGVCIPHVRLISREIMQITIPSCVNTICLTENGKNNEYVAIYVATPYGITNHLHVPVYNRSAVNVDPSKQAALKSSEAMPAGTRNLTPASDSSTAKLIPFSTVGPSDARASQISLEERSTPIVPTEYLQEISRLGAMEALQAVQAVPAEFTVHVQTAEASAQSLQEQSPQRAPRGGLAINQLRVKVRECWRNVRDKLPGN